ncbi:MAG: hypothetical protein JNN12_04750 [Bacteroidetes Order II. Incertae sedis bacterium]|nr:hypothetical protein [Bacteroidetes Order II. bacterium]
MVYNAGQGGRYDKAWAKCLRTGKVSARTIELLSIPYTLVMCLNRNRKAADKTLFLLSNLKGRKAIAQTYLMRWKIERMFKQLKSEGYDIEAVNLKTAERRCLLILAACIAFALTVAAAWGRYKKFKTINRKDGLVHLRWSDLGGHKSNLILCHEETRTSIKSCKCEPVAAQV